MIFGHSFFSLIKDIKAFGNITKIREDKFNSASSDFEYKQGGVEALGKMLHPETQKFTVEDISFNDEGIVFVKLKAENKKAALFRAGQYINILCGDLICPFFLSGVPTDALKGEYEIAIDGETDKRAYEFLSKLKKGDTVTTGAPMGYFFRKPQRDKAPYLLICDITGFGALKSMFSELTSLGEQAEIVFLKKGENISQQTVNKASTVFVCGKKAFCEDKKNKYSFNNIQCLFTDIPHRAEKESIYKCTVLYGDKEFSFDCSAAEPLINALERNGQLLFNKCRTGDCSFCRAKLMEGNITHIFNDDDSRRKSDVVFGYIHPCRAFPDSDIIIKY